MQVYKVFFRILNKQKIRIIMYLAIFLSISVVVSLQGEETQEGVFKAQSQKIAVFDDDGSELSRGMVRYLSEGNEIIKIDDEKETIQDELYNRNITGVIRIPKGYEESFTGDGNVMKVQVISIPATISAEILKSMVNRYSSIAKAYRAGGFDLQQAAQKTVSVCKEEVSVSLSEGAKESSHEAMYYFFAYFPYIFISISVVGIGAILVVFHNKEVRERNICSCYPLSRMNMELYTAMVITEIGFCFCYFIVVLLGMRDFQLFSFQGMLYCLNTLCFMVVTLGIVFLIGQMVKKAPALNMISNIIALGMSFLCGIFVPLEYLGEGLVKVAHFLPAYWYITSAVEIDSYTAGKELGELWQGLGIQLLFGVAFVCAGLAYSKAKVAAGQRE